MSFTICGYILLKSYYVGNIYIITRIFDLSVIEPNRNSKKFCVVKLEIFKTVLINSFAYI